MASRTLLSPEEQTRQLASLNGWNIVDGAICKSFQFADFVTAWGFMSRVALLAQQMDHHPDWRNVYNRVEISLSTHSAGGITGMDIALATQIEQLEIG
ncbi:MAG: 4a-hydroxytetrahydrobiopterin dehydratase [Armatimonadetes bacterium]|nr:4a-hydroxytetrahydrobiopterin dehydratase [Armatimonadota bacterium]MDE2207501.1 4a-hydroxytetrahydrobiopterin dehydratase [Armatimonadota bacterium]